MGSLQEHSETGVSRKTPQPNSAFCEAPPCCCGLVPPAQGPRGSFRVPYRQGALIGDWRGRRPGLGCRGPHCRLSKRFYTHSREAEAGTVIFIHRVADKAREKSTGRTDTQTFDSEVLEWPPWGTPQDPWGRGTCCHQPPHPLVSSPSIWFWVERG